MLLRTSGSLQNRYLRHRLCFTENRKESTEQQVYHQQRRAGCQPCEEEVIPSPPRRCCGGVSGAALSKKSAHGGAAQRAASGSSGRHQEVTGGNWRLWALFQCVSPRMGVCEPLSTVHGLCQSRRAVSITQAWQLSLLCSPMGVPVRTHTRGWVHSDGDSPLL